MGYWLSFSRLIFITTHSSFITAHILGPGTLTEDILSYLVQNDDVTMMFGFHLLINTKISEIKLRTV